MKFKDGWDKAYEETPSAEAEKRWTAAARAAFDAQAEAPVPFWKQLFRPIVLVPALGAAFGFAVFFQMQEKPGAPVFVQQVRFDPEMVANSDLLLDLKVLRNLPSLKKLGKQKWRTKKS